MEDTCPPCGLRLRGGTGKAKPKKHTAAELAAKAKAANESVGGGKAGIAERDKNAKLTTECLEPGCAGTKLTSLTVCSASFIYLFRPVFRDFFLALFSPCADLVPLSCACAETHWSNKHCTCRRAPNPETGYCECFPVEKYEPLFQKCHEVVKTHHNQAATLSSNKNASKAVRDKVKAQQAAAAIIDASRQQSKQFTQKNNGTIS